MDVVSQEMTQVTADKPVLVMQYVKGKAADLIDSDPAMNRVIPNEQFVRKATFPVVKLNSDLLNDTYVAVTTECDNFESLYASMNNLQIQVRVYNDKSKYVLHACKSIYPAYTAAYT